MLNELLNLPKRAQIATIYTITTPKFKKGGPQGVVKHSKTQVMLNSIYRNVINNQLRREGKEPYEPQPRAWGQRIKGTPLVEHKGKYYLETQYLKTIETKYYQNGIEIDESELRPFMREQSYMTNKPIIWRDYSLDSIEWIHVNNKKIEKNISSLD